jgi:uncharacterized protein YndB with AHSA1/START domain
VSTQATDLTIHKTVIVAAPVEQAFETFTERLGEWWPTDTHSIGHDRVEAVILEGAVGGRLFERHFDGEEASWGRVLAWEPPTRLVLEWRVNEEWPAPTEIEVRFSAEGDGTRVELEHRGWERLGASAAESSANYNKGWDVVLAPFVARLS